MFLSAQINAAGFIRRKAEKFFYIFCSLRRTRLPCGEGADFSETAQAHCCPCAAFQGLKKHHVQFCLFSVVDRHLCLRKRCHIVAKQPQAPESFASVNVTFKVSDCPAFNSTVTDCISFFFALVKVFVLPPVTV